MKDSQYQDNELRKEGKEGNLERAKKELQFYQ